MTSKKFFMVGKDLWGLWQGCIIFNFKVSRYSFYNPPFPLSQTFGKDLLPSVQPWVRFLWMKAVLTVQSPLGLLFGRTKVRSMGIQSSVPGPSGWCRRAEDTKK